VIECKGPTNTRIFSVAVYFRGQRLAKGSGHSIQQAEMSAAEKALQSSKSMFPQLNYQKRVIERSLRQQGEKSDTDERSGGRRPGDKRQDSEERHGRPETRHDRRSDDRSRDKDRGRVRGYERSRSYDRRSDERSEGRGHREKGETNPSKRRRIEEIRRRSSEKSRTSTECRRDSNWCAWTDIL